LPAFWQPAFWRFLPYLLMEKDSWDARIDMRTVEAAANAAAIASAADHAVEMPWGLKTSMDRVMAAFLEPVSALKTVIETAPVTA
jgi:hypothetical protein